MQGLYHHVLGLKGDNLFSWVVSLALQASHLVRISDSGFNFMNWQLDNDLGDEVQTTQATNNDFIPHSSDTLVITLSVNWLHV